VEVVPVEELSTHAELIDFPLVLVAWISLVVVLLLV
jgi:hypothetical protein